MTRIIVFLIACELAAPALLIGQTGLSGTATQPAVVPAKTVAPARSAIRNRKSQNEPGAKKQFQQQPTAGQPVQRQVRQQRAVAQQRMAADRNRTSNQFTLSFTQATERQHHQRHDRNWWKTHFTTIVFVHRCGYFYWDAGYWLPAWGYYPAYENFEYNGPIYTYGNLLPDQVIYNVQRTLKDLGYYAGPLSGSLSTGTRNAISAFQEDYGLDVTGAIDEPTVETLGLY